MHPNSPYLQGRFCIGQLCIWSDNCTCEHSKNSHRQHSYAPPYTTGYTLYRISSNRVRGFYFFASPRTAASFRGRRRFTLVSYWSSKLLIPVICFTPRASPAGTWISWLVAGTYMQVRLQEFEVLYSKYNSSLVALYNSFVRNYCHWILNWSAVIMVDTSYGSTVLHSSSSTSLKKGSPPKFI